MHSLFYFPEEVEYRPPKNIKSFTNHNMLISWKPSGLEIINEEGNFTAMTDFLKHLNEAQQKAVKDTEGPALIIAGAGSGKTRVLTYRIAWLLANGVPAHTILALTFTNKAAAEMKERINKLVGAGNARYLWMGTFHSVFSRILRAEAGHTGYSSNFTIYDTQDSRNVIKAIIKEMLLDDQVYKPGEIYGRISLVKNSLITPQAYASNSSLTAEDNRRRKPMIAEIYKKYRQRCVAADAMDFDDLLLNTNILFRDHPGVLDKYRNAFRYILVDEYQDTNYAQYLIVSKLASGHGNLAVVGDDAQSIYSFRGARIENILNFKKDYPGYKLFKLEQNYRSTRTIVNAANSVIARNRNRISKKVWSANEEGDRIKIAECATDHLEGDLAAGLIGEKTASGDAGFSDFAILYRTNAQSRIFEEVLRRRGIPYKVYGSLSFYQRKEIKDLLAYFRLTVNKRDLEAFYRIINYPARGIGKTTTDRLNRYCNENGLVPWDVISNPGLHAGKLGFNRGTVSRLMAFAGMIKGFDQVAETADAWEASQAIATSSGILKELFDPRSPENIAKYENIQELLNGVREFTEAQKVEGEDTSLAGFLRNVSLLTDQDTDKPDDRNKVTLMTVHSAKGLEFRHVFIGGLEEELFPNHMASSTPEGLEEERRLFYVALTRAGSTATLSHSQTRYRWGTPVMCKPSRFIEEIDSKFVDYTFDLPAAGSPGSERLPGRYTEGPFAGRRPQSGYRMKKKKDKSQVRTDNETPAFKTPLRKLRRIGRDEAAGSDSKPASANPAETRNNLSNTPAEQASVGTGADASGFSPGMTVEHDRFGRGTITALEGQSPNVRATVVFDGAGQKHLLLKFARLRAVSG